MRKLPPEQHNAIGCFVYHDRTNCSQSVPLKDRYGVSVVIALLAADYIYSVSDGSTFYGLTSKGKAYRRDHFPLLTEQIVDLQDALRTIMNEVPYDSPAYNTAYEALKTCGLTDVQIHPPSEFSDE